MQVTVMHMNKREDDIFNFYSFYLYLNAIDPMIQTD